MMIRTYIETGRTIVPAPEPVWEDIWLGPTDRRWKMRCITNNPCQAHWRIVGKSYVDGEYISDYVQYIPLDPFGSKTAAEAAKKEKKMIDENIDEHQFAIEPTDGEAVAEILALSGFNETVIQTEEDLGPKDHDLPM